MKKVLEPVTETIENVFEDATKTKTMTENSKENNEALSNLNNKLLEKKNDKGTILHLICCLRASKVINPEHTTHFKVVQDPGSNRFNDRLVNKTIPVILYDNLLTFRDTDKKFKLQEDLLKMKFNKIYAVDLANLSDKKLKFDFAKEMHFDEKALGNKYIGEKSLIKLPESHTNMTSGFSTIFLPENPNELCDKLKLVLHEKQARNTCNTINGEFLAIADKLFEKKTHI